MNLMSINLLTRKKLLDGSWKDVKYFLQVSSRDYEYADQAKVILDLEL